MSLAIAGCSDDDNNNVTVDDNALIKETLNKFAKALNEKDFDARDDLLYNTDTIQNYFLMGDKEHPYVFEKVVISVNGNFADIKATGQFPYHSPYSWSTILYRYNIEFEMQKFNDGWKIDATLFSDEVNGE